MVNNKTYNNVVNTLLRLGEYHDQISTTSVGDIFDINLEKMQKFPLLHINPTSVTVTSAVSSTSEYRGGVFNSMD